MNMCLETNRFRAMGPRRFGGRWAKYRGGRNFGISAWVNKTRVDLLLPFMGRPAFVRFALSLTVFELLDPKVMILGSNNSKTLRDRAKRTKSGLKRYTLVNLTKV